MANMDQLDDGRIEFGKESSFDVDVISKEELYENLRRHDPILLVNVSDPKHYDLGSIKTSLRIPLAEIETRLMELDKSKEIITYCETFDSHDAKAAAKLLKEHG